MNDGSISATLLKAIKRAMAGEYSRELSVKVFAGKCRLIDLGFRQGGPAGFGLRRLVIDQHRTPKGILSRGEQKNLITDRVILVPGPEEEIKVVREVFRKFTEERKPPKTIATMLNECGILSEQGRPWTRYMIYDMVTNPKYVGTNVSNRTSCKLRSKSVKNPPEMWVQRENAFAPIIDTDTFEKAQWITADRTHRYSEPELCAALDGLLRREGRLSLSLVRKSSEVPCPEVYEKHFGGLLGAYRAIGYVPKGDFSYLEGARQLHKIHEQMVLRFVAELVASGATVKRNRSSLTVNEEFTLRFKVARCSSRTSKWTLRLSPRSDVDMTVVARMEPGNESVLDYYIVPKVHHFSPATTLSLDNGFHTDTYRFADLSFLIKLARRVKLENRS